MSQESDFGSLEDEVARLSSRVSSMEEDLKDNTAATTRVEKNTEDLVAAFEALKGAFKVLEIIGKVGKPVLIIAGIPAAVAAIWALAKKLLNF
jgi:hypothetical protein